MTKTGNKVFWLVYGNYERPESEDWTNANSSIFDLAYGCYDFKDCVGYVSKEISEGRVSKYVIVTDTVLKEDKEILRKNFISNNVINVMIPYNTYKIGKQIEWIFSDFGMNKMNNDIFFTSDQHFWHGNIIRYCNRPWNSGKDSNGDLIVTEGDVERMNEEMVSRWNSVVSKDSTVYCLGDFCLGKNQKENIPKLVSRLNGKINLILGNHDHHSVRFYYEAGFNRVYDRKIIINDFVVLSHAPMEFVKSPWFNIYGHVHDCETYKTWSKDSCCVCVERHEYKPVSWKEIQRHYEELNSENC